MKILAFLQNQWFRDPDRAKQVLAYYCEKKGGESRNRFIRDMLFMGCLTGRRLRSAFGEDLCGEIIWEESSPEIHGKASAAPPASCQHMLNSLDLHRPDVVLLFGKIAQEGFARLPLGGLGRMTVIKAPHPAARHLTVMQELGEAAIRLRETIKEPPCS